MKTRNGLFADVPENLWNDWHWQVANRAETVEDLKKYMNLTPDEEEGVRKTLGKLRMAVTPYYLSLIDLDDPFDPIGPNGAAADEEEFMLAVAEAGGDDYEDADEEWIVYTAPGDLMAVVKELEAQGIQVKGAEMTMIANTPSAVSVADAKKVMRLIDKLEELEDLQAVYHTMDITDEIAEALDE